MFDEISLNHRMLGSMFDQAMNHPACTAPRAKDVRQKRGKPVLLLSHGEYSIIHYSRTSKHSNKNA